MHEQGSIPTNTHKHTHTHTQTIQIHTMYFFNCRNKLGLFPRAGSVFPSVAETLSAVWEHELFYM